MSRMHPCSQERLCRFWSWAPVRGPVAQGSAAANSNQLDEVVVTAQRTTERLQDVPIAVSALSSAQLEERQIVTTNDLGRSVPNLVASNNVGLSTASAFFLRGVGQDESIATSDPAVGTYVDGVYISRQVANNAYLYDIERIEVLRGPQGTLYGRNTSGGAISIITRKPGPDLRGSLGGSYGNYGRYDVKGSDQRPDHRHLLCRRLRLRRQAGRGLPEEDHQRAARL